MISVILNLLQDLTRDLKSYSDYKTQVLKQVQYDTIDYLVVVVCSTLVELSTPQPPQSPRFASRACFSNIR